MLSHSLRGALRKTCLCAVGLLLIGATGAHSAEVGREIEFQDAASPNFRESSLPDYDDGSTADDQEGASLDAKLPGTKPMTVAPKVAIDQVRSFFIC